MTDLATADSVISTLDIKTDASNKRPLRNCVEDAIDDYFTHLGGHPVGDLYQMVLAEVEHPLLTCVMKQVNGNQSKAAEMLGINRGTLRKKLKTYGIQ